MSSQTETFKADDNRIFDESLKDGNIQLDTFGYAAIQRAAEREAMVGFPLQLVLIKFGEPIIEKYPVDEQNYKPEPLFLLQIADKSEEGKKELE